MAREVVVPAEWVAERLDEIAVIDVRDPWEYDGIGHLPGAANVPFDRFRAQESGAAEAGMLPGAGVFADLGGAAGVSAESDVVAYDDTHGVFAARFLVTALLYGHPLERLHLLDGDYSAWSRERAVSRDAAEPEPADYEAAFDPSGPLITIDAVRAAVEDSETVILDTREDWEYAEGHIPGAARIDWRAVIDDETRGLRSRDELFELFAERGVERGRRIVLYCNTARRISHTYLVLRELGFDDVAFYEGSLTEWEAEGGEVVTGEG